MIDESKPYNTINFDKVEIIPLGAGCEVGRSCIVLRYRDKTVMFDCGLHQGKSGTEALPILNSEWLNPDLSEINVILISHFHNDHCAAVPYVVGMTKFCGRIFMTHPTKAIYLHVLKDYIQIAKRFETGALYNIDDLERSLNLIEVLNFHQLVNLNGIKVCAFMAGHVLGAAMFHINIYECSILYTGDYSRETDRHMPKAELPDTSLNLVIIESTYGVSNHLPRSEREEKFIQTIIQCVIHKKGKVLLPIVALGRAQEILLILEQFWEKNSILHQVPVYQVSAIAAQAIPIYYAFIEMMNDDIKKEIKYRNPFHFKHVLLRDKAKHLVDTTWPCVVLTSPATMMSGTSRELFERWCEEDRNNLIITDFALQGSIARQVLSEPKNLASRDGRPLKLRMSVLAISFSAHADFKQTSEFIEIVKVPKVILVHGEKREIYKLSKEISYLANSRGVERYVYSPDTGQGIQLYQRAEKTINVVGILAREKAFEGLPLNAIFLQKGIENILIDYYDLKNYTKLQLCNIKHRLTLPMKHNYNSSNVLLVLASNFKNILIDKKNKTIKSKIKIASKLFYGKITFSKIIVEGIVSVTMLSVKISSGKLKNREYLILEWKTNIIAEAYAHAIIAIILQERFKPYKMNNKEKTSLDKEVSLAKINIILDILRVQISPIWCLNHQKRTMSSRVDGISIQINHKNLARYMNAFCPEDGCLETRVNLKIKTITTVSKIHTSIQ